VAQDVVWAGDRLLVWSDWERVRRQGNQLESAGVERQLGTERPRRARLPARGRRGLGRQQGSLGPAATITLGWPGEQRGRVDRAGGPVLGRRNLTGRRSGHRPGIHARPVGTPQQASGYRYRVARLAGIRALVSVPRMARSATIGLGARSRRARKTSLGWNAMAAGPWPVSGSGSPNAFSPWPRRSGGTGKSAHLTSEGRLPRPPARPRWLVSAHGADCNRLPAAPVLLAVQRRAAEASGTVPALEESEGVDVEEPLLGGVGVVGVVPVQVARGLQGRLGLGRGGCGVAGLVQGRGARDVRAGH
jgi:hypothetical protein